MRVAIVLLALLLLLLQYKLWFAKSGAQDVAQLRHAIAVQQRENQQLAKRNATLAEEVMELKHGQAAAKERARQDLGMIKKDETYYQLIPKADQ